ncbi:MAG: KpsF/GutQ family sugar-phosphate isomerase [Hyphomicrobiales bacterium]|nr:KpsF/GutQ family sugar-phosphate isomerase [Hyphomicrobiales bacterium]MDE2115702.1 KpsF/GutQ family sugar-phosphate isomerase [Hyphomicrobiales bacterium]
MSKDSRASALRTIAVERAGLSIMEAALNDVDADGLGTRLTQAIERLQRISGHLIITGMGKSGHIGRKLAATFASTGTPAYFVHPAEASHGDLGMIRSGDAILALSWSGETSELADIILYSRRFDIPLIAITSNRDSAVGREADICLVLPKAEEACPNGLAPTTSTTMQLVLGDALAVALLEARGFSAQDFRQFHPGGKLGARLTLVRDVMHKESRLPLVSESASMAEAVMEISGKGVGCVGVINDANRLIGIVTDGDLRRHMRADLMAMPVVDVMSRNPKVIRPDALAVEALQILESSKITSVFVVDAERNPCGVIHIHDLLQLGVA